MPSHVVFSDHHLSLQPLLSAPSSHAVARLPALALQILVLLLDAAPAYRRSAALALRLRQRCGDSDEATDRFNAGLWLDWLRLAAGGGGGWLRLDDWRRDSRGAGWTGRVTRLVYGDKDGLGVCAKMIFLDYLSHCLL